MNRYERSEIYRMSIELEEARFISEKLQRELDWSTNDRDRLSNRSEALTRRSHDREVAIAELAKLAGVYDNYVVTDEYGEHYNPDLLVHDLLRQKEANQNTQEAEERTQRLTVNKKGTK